MGWALCLRKALPGRPRHPPPHCIGLTGTGSAGLLALHGIPFTQLRQYQYLEVFKVSNPKIV